MKKTLFYMAALCAMTLGFVSCDKEEEDGANASYLYGYWQAVSQEIVGYVNGEEVEDEYYEDEEVGGIRFTKDGDFYYWWEEDGDIETEYAGTYSYKDGKLEGYDEVEDDPFSLDVETLTSKKLVFKYTESWSEDGDEYKYVATSTYQKLDVK